MFYIIYETTNIINGKKYIGKHATDNVEDDYLGSGIALRKAIQKYGRGNFTKRILFIFYNEADMNKKEQEIIDVDIVRDRMYYNAAVGGRGGNIVLKPDHPLYDHVRKKISQAQNKRNVDMSEITKRNHALRRVGMYGKHQSDKQKRIVREMWKGVPKTEEAKKKQKASLLSTLNDPTYIHPNTGRKKTKEQIDCMRVASSNRPKKICPFCGIEMDERNYARYHGEKCKHAKIQLEDSKP